MIDSEVCDDCKEAGKTNPSDCPECIRLHVAYATSMGKASPVQVYHIVCTYTASDAKMIELPLYKNWDDIEEWYVKWKTFHYILKGETQWREIDVEGDIEIEDTKRPANVTVFDEDYAEEVDSQ